MKKLAIALLALIALSSCFKEGGSSYKWYRDYKGVLTNRYDGINPETGDVVSMEFVNDEQESRLECENAYKNVLNFYLNKVRFVEAMPELNICLPNMSFSLSDGSVYELGAWIINIDSLIPTIGGVEYPGYEMHSVRMVISDTSITLSFWLMLNGVRYDVRYVVDNNPLVEE